MIINQFTQFDAYPLPCIDEMIGEIDKYETFSNLDLKIAYHQVEINLKDELCTAFEACG